MPSLRSRKNRQGARTPSMCVRCGTRHPYSARPARLPRIALRQPSGTAPSLARRPGRSRDAARRRQPAARRRSKTRRARPGPRVQPRRRRGPTAGCRTRRRRAGRERAFKVGDRSTKAVRHCDERLVAGVVAEAVVHFLHAVDVEHEQRHGPTGVAALSSGLRAVRRAREVGEAGDQVLEREALERARCPGGRPPPRRRARPLEGIRCRRC